MRRSQAVQAEGANRASVPAPNIQEGSQVWLHARHIQTMGPTRTIDWKELGPFIFVRRISPYAYEPELPALIRIHSVQLVSLLDRLVNDPLEGQPVNLPPPGHVDGEEEYQVSSLEDSRIYRNQLQYAIRFTAYDTLVWEPVKFVGGLQAVGKCHQVYPGKPGPL